MGAINFIGGSWTGGGSGYLVKAELMEFCNECHCYSDTCEDFDNHTIYFETESDNESVELVYNEIKDNLDEISNYVISLIKDKTFTWKTLWHGKRTYKLETILNGLEENNIGDILEIHHGYYDGFQIIANRNHLSELWRHNYENGYGWYTYEDSYLPENIVEEIYKLINDTMANENFNLWAWEK